MMPRVWMISHFRLEVEELDPNEGRLGFVPLYRYGVNGGGPSFCSVDAPGPDTVHYSAAQSKQPAQRQGSLTRDLANAKHRYYRGPVPEKRHPAEIPQAPILGNGGIVSMGVFGSVEWRAVREGIFNIYGNGSRGEPKYHSIPTLLSQSVRQQGWTSSSFNIGFGHPRKAASRRAGGCRTRTRSSGSIVYERCSLCFNTPTRVKPCFEAEGNPISKCDPPLPP
ncbi:hypothetical protein B0J18DRAFT_118176 [Chaetomium sp. MPI-SDFR-AT-0129]|nr:hypothetical protein B0J18DRAFT_118176 [Chaetomium sp. MPI-SDFR-AT-0129]